MPRVRAPELTGRGWLGTGGTSYSIRDLRGRFVLLDFWTFCCVNCLHVIEELRPLQEEYAEELVVVGVHSPKFAHEADADALVAAVERYGVDHPVLDDPELVTWRAYTARAWPTLVLIDPEGYVVAQYAGEGHAHAISRLLGELVGEHRERGTLQPGAAPYVEPPVAPGDLRFPADAVPLPGGGADGRVLVADAGHDELVVLDGAGGAVVRRFGGFREPNGLCLLPPEVAQQVGYDVVVADTGAHRLAGLTLGTGAVCALADDRGLSSPWDVAWWRDRVWVAEAGRHQLWTFDPMTTFADVVAGTTHEGLVDGPLDEAWFAQPSGLAGTDDRLWLVDAETSALRLVEDDGHGPVVRTVVGQGLFDFGLRDGPASQALLQHPLGVTVLPDGGLVVCDTYNGALRHYDPATEQVSTLATGLAEPASAYVDGTDLVVVESAAHRLTRIPLSTPTRIVEGFAQTTGRPVVEVTAELDLEVRFVPPPGQQVDDRLGPATQLVVEATPAMLIRHGAGRDTGLTRRLLLDPTVGNGVLHVAARAGSCDVGEENEPAPGAACHVHHQDWGVSVRVDPGGDHVLTLPLGGQDGVSPAPA